MPVMLNTILTAAGFPLGDVRLLRHKDKGNPQHVRIARHLSEHGPTPGGELADTVKLTVDQFWAVNNHPWFDLTGKGYMLSDEGKRELLG